MHNYAIPPARRGSLSAPRRGPTRTTTRRVAQPPVAPVSWRILLFIGWQLRQGIIRPRLAGLTLLLVWSLVLWLGLAHLLQVWPVVQAAATATPMSARPTPPPVSSVAERVRALYQGDSSIGWDSTEQYRTWWPSACAPAALTELLRAWGTNVGIGSVLDRLWTLHAISAEGGLLHAEALATVAEGYGY